MNPCDFVLFGAMGDLARRKLLPSLYQLEKADLIEQETTIVGVARSESTDEKYVSLAQESLEKFMNEPVDSAVWERLARRLRYVQVDLKQSDQYGRLLDKVDQTKRATVNYFAVAPDVFGSICQGLAAAGDGHGTGESRAGKAHPGTDLASSRRINDAVGASR